MVSANDQSASNRRPRSRNWATATVELLFGRRHVSTSSTVAATDTCHHNRGPLQRPVHSEAVHILSRVAWQVAGSVSTRSVTKRCSTKSIFPEMTIISEGTVGPDHRATMEMATSVTLRWAANIITIIISWSIRTFRCAVWDTAKRLRPVNGNICSMTSPSRRELEKYSASSPHPVIHLLASPPPPSPCCLFFGWDVKIIARSREKLVKDHHLFPQHCRCCCCCGFNSVDSSFLVVAVTGLRGRMHCFYHCINSRNYCQIFRAWRNGCARHSGEEETGGNGAQRGRFQNTRRPHCQRSIDSSIQRTLRSIGLRAAGYSLVPRHDCQTESVVHSTVTGTWSPGSQLWYERKGK